MEQARILFVDDEEPIRDANRQTLDLAGFAVETFELAEQALERVTAELFGVVVSDIRLPKMSGVDLLQQVQQIDPDLPLILISGHADVDLAVGAIHQGAYDFIQKPFAADRLVETVRRALEKRRLTLENRQLRSQVHHYGYLGPRIIGKTAAVEQLRDTISRVADTAADILIVGETGTGKEMVARTLHEQSGRRQHNFVAINCGAVPESIIESELFGHEAGAFTGAEQRRIGKFEHADGGTLFLDEIESMPLTAQVRLLRVLQDRAVERLGSNELVPLDLRVVAASKVDLRKAADAGEFREDLYYRLNVVTIEIPPLRHRVEDIALLFQHFLLVASERYGREISPPEAVQMSGLLSHDWPGNVRELRNVAERYVLLGEGCDLAFQQLFEDEEEKQNLRTLPRQVECFERSVIEQALGANRGSIKGTLQQLGVARKTLYDKMQKYGLDKRDFKGAPTAEG